MAETKGYIRTSDEKGSVNISQSVVATIAAAAASDVDGVYRLCQSQGKEITEINGKKGLSKGARVTIEDESVTIDLYLLVEVGHSVSETAAKVQDAVVSAIEEAVDFKVSTVNVHVCGVSMRKTPAPVQSRKPTAAPVKK